MDKKLTDNEIVKALECEATEKVCVHEAYEPACGIWCKHLHKWCADMSGRSDKNNCSAFKPIESTKRAKATLDLINRQKAEIEQWQGGYMTQKQEIANLEIELKAMRGAANSYKAEVERLNNCVKSEDEVREIAKRTMEPLVREIAREQIDTAVKLAKAEAYKEFAQRQEIELAHNTNISAVGYQTIIAFNDNLLKELVGEK